MPCLFIPFYQFDDIVDMGGTLQIVILDTNEPNSHWEKNKFSPLFKELIGRLSQQGVPLVTPIISSYDVVQGEYPRSLNEVNVICKILLTNDSPNRPHYRRSCPA